MCLFSAQGRYYEWRPIVHCPKLTNYTKYKLFGNFYLYIFTKGSVFITIDELSVIVLFFIVVILVSILTLGVIIHTMSDNVKYLNDILTKIFNEVKK